MRRPRALRTARLAKALALAAPLLCHSLAAADSSSGGDISLETRAFDPDGDALTEDYGFAFSGRLKGEYERQPFRLKLRVFARRDLIDETRDVAALEEASAAYKKGPLTLTVGAQVLNWTAMEAFHPADVVNSRNFDSDLENFDKFGEPMVELSLLRGRSSLRAYYMPMRIDPKLPGAGSRLSFYPAGLEIGDPLWVEADGTISESLFAHQGALHFSQTVGRADLGVHVIQHSDRNQPSLTIDPETGQARPTYHTVRQAGVTGVVVFGGLLLKTEASYRTFLAPDPDNEEGIAPQPDHAIGAAGLEYGWTNGAGHATTLYAEVQAVGLDNEFERARLTPFQRDLFLGYRYALNDVSARSFFAFFIADLERAQEYVAALEYSQRVYDLWTVEATLRSLRVLGRRADGAQLSVTRHF